MKVRELLYPHAGDNLRVYIYDSYANEDIAKTIGSATGSESKFGSRWLDAEVEYWYIDEGGDLCVSVYGEEAESDIVSSTKKSFTAKPIKASRYSSRSTYPTPIYEYILVDGVWGKGNWDQIESFDNQRDAEAYAQDEGEAFSHISLYLVIYEFDLDGEYYPSAESPILLCEYENGRRI